MRSFLLACAASASLALAACSPSPAPDANASGSVGASAGQVSAIAATAMYAAEATYNVPAHAYVEADSQGLLSDEVKAKVKPILIDAYEWLLKARSAYEAGDRAGFYEARSNLEQKASAASDLLPATEGTG